jgi:hypothetical protein
MNANPNTRTKHLSIAGVILIAIAAVAGAWVLLPAGAQAGQMPSVSIVRAGAVDDVHVNVPMNEIQDGQFCQAYAVVHIGTPPYQFTWSGQFNNSFGETGPLGENQIVNGNIDELARGELLKVVVRTSGGVYLGEDEVQLNIDDEHEYNEACEA